MRGWIVGLCGCAIVAACGGTDGGNGNPDGGGELGNPDGSVSTDGAAPDSSMCKANGAVCTAMMGCSQTGECCSKNCVNGVCADKMTCRAPGLDCNPKMNDCCSGRCEPVFGMANVTKCANVCLPDGQACAKAIDCCSLGCWNGKCGQPECTLEGQACKVNADCCSNNCDPNKHECALDPMNTMCRGTGESCNSGPQMGCCSGICDKSQNPERCGSNACKPEGVSCTIDADCCHGICDPMSKKCKTPCTGDGSACATNCDCCGGNCTAGKCAPPPNPCQQTGQTFTVDGDCCLGFCFAGSCTVPPR